MNIVSRTSLAALLIATVVCGHATAAGLVAPRQEVVPFADLNLNHPKGVEALYIRLSQAAHRVCSVDGTKLLMLRGAARECTKSSLRDAVALVNDTGLTAYHMKATHESMPAVARVASGN